MKRLPALDGLRGLAVSLVLLHHMAIWPQGWIGVDLFFVLSGYLITTILLAERAELHFWRIFYLRRVTRILPAFLLFLLLSSFTGRVPWRELGPYVALTGADFAYLHHAAAMSHSGLGILWSLSVEEHFYFVWPMLVRRCTRRLLACLLLGIVVLEPAARAAATLSDAPWTVTYFLTPFRLDGLAFGSLLALALQHGRARALLQRYAGYACGTALLVLLCMTPWFHEGQHVLFQGVVAYPWLAITGALCVAFLTLDSHSIAARVLSLRPFVFMGRISYGLYLYHVVIILAMLDFAWAHGYAGTRRVMYLSLPVSILASWLSFRFLESPILVWGRRATRGYMEERAVRAQSA